MMFDVTITRFGFVRMEADTESEAMEMANNLTADQITWSEDYEATDAQEAED